jgi:hypothetical protein
MRTLLIGAALVAAVGAGSASAQESGELVLYSKGHFKGASRTLDGPSQYMVVFTVRSVQVPAGQEWELCTGNKFSGCRRISASDPTTAMTIRSVRPAGQAALAAATAAAVAAGVPVASVAPQVLRGVASEYFVAPAEGGNRVELPAGGNAGARADAFCRARGWRSAGHEDVQNMAGRTFLADVLCIAKD